MENFKQILKIGGIVTVIGILTACGGDDDNNGGNNSPQGVISVKTFECDSPNEKSKMIIHLKEHTDFSDELVSLEVEGPGVKIKMDLLLGLRIRSQYEIRQALYYNEGRDTGQLKDLSVVRDPYTAPEVLVLDTYEGWVEVRSRPLQRVLRTGLAPRFEEEDFEVESEHAEGRPRPPAAPPRPPRSSSVIYTCEQR